MRKAATRGLVDHEFICDRCGELAGGEHDQKENGQVMTTQSDMMANGQMSRPGARQYTTA